MSVGATDTWSQSRDEIIADALANVGAIGPGQEAVGAMREHAARALNRIVKSRDADGAFLWRVTRITFTTTDGTAAYTLNGNVFAIEDPMTYLPAGGTSRTTLWPMARDEYMAIADRTVEGRPTRYFIEKTITGNGRIQLAAQLDPVPNTTGDTIEYVACLRAKDYVTGATSSDFPTNFIKALVYELTAELAPAYSQAELVMQFKPLAEAEWTKQLNADNEQMGLTFVPFGWGNY